MLKCSRHIQSPVRAWVNPAGRVRFYFFVDAAAGQISVHVNDSFHQPGNRNQWFIGRPGSCLFLGCIIIERPGLICHQLLVIVGIHCIGKTVVIVSRIGYAGKYLPAVCICDNDGSGTWFQRKLPRRDL